MIDEKCDERLDNAVQRRGGQLREPSVGEDDFCGNADQIREQYAKQGEAANDVDEVETFVCGDRVRSLRNGWRDSHNERPAHIRSNRPGLDQQIDAHQP